MSIINQLTKYEDWLVEVVKWYKSRKYKLPIKSFIELEPVFQLGVLELYLADKHNIGIIYSTVTYTLYWINPKHKVANKEIMDRHNETEVLSHHFYDAETLKQVDTVTAKQRAILKAIEFINEPF